MAEAEYPRTLSEFDRWFATKVRWPRTSRHRGVLFYRLCSKGSRSPQSLTGVSSAAERPRDHNVWGELD